MVSANHSPVWRRRVRTAKRSSSETLNFGRGGAPQLFQLITRVAETLSANHNEPFRPTTRSPESGFNSSVLPFSTDIKQHIVPSVKTFLGQDLNKIESENVLCVNETTALMVGATRLLFHAAFGGADCLLQLDQ